jgi:hypothetical protein
MIIVPPVGRDVDDVAAASAQGGAHLDGQLGCPLLRPESKIDVYVQAIY